MVRPPRVAALASALALAALAAAPGARAQSPCGDSVTVTVGDTLHAIAERCETPIEALLEANPGIADPDVIEVGRSLALPAAGDAQSEAAEDEDAETARTGEAGRRARRGETLSSIAEEFETSVQAVIEANPGLDPQNIPVGRLIEPPYDEPHDGAAPPGEAAVTLGAAQAAPGEAVAVRAGGFPAGAAVQIGVGPPQSEFEIVARARADAAGRLRQEVEVPAWASQHASLVFVAQTPDARIRAASEPLPVAGAPGGDGAIRVTGRVVEGVECPALSGDDGNLYSLAMPDRERVQVGDRVEVRGSAAEASVCLQGTAIAVDSIRPAP